MKPSTQLILFMLVFVSSNVTCLTQLESGGKASRSDTAMSKRDVIVDGDVRGQKFKGRDRKAKKLKVIFKGSFLVPKSAVSNEYMHELQQLLNYRLGRVMTSQGLRLRNFAIKLGKKHLNRPKRKQRRRRKKTRGRKRPEFLTHTIAIQNSSFPFEALYSEARRPHHKISGPRNRGPNSLTKSQRSLNQKAKLSRLEGMSTSVASPYIKESPSQDRYFSKHPQGNHHQSPKEIRPSTVTSFIKPETSRSPEHRFQVQKKHTPRGNTLIPTTQSSPIPGKTQRNSVHLLRLVTDHKNKNEITSSTEDIQTASFIRPKISSSPQLRRRMQTQPASRVNSFITTTQPFLSPGKTSQNPQPSSKKQQRTTKRPPKHRLRMQTQPNPKLNHFITATQYVTFAGKRSHSSRSSSKKEPQGLFQSTWNTRLEVDNMDGQGLLEETTESPVTSSVPPKLETGRFPDSVSDPNTTTENSRTKPTDLETKTVVELTQSSSATRFTKSKQTQPIPVQDSESVTPSYRASDALLPRSIRTFKATLQPTSVPGQFVTPMDNYLEAYESFVELIGYFGTIWYFASEGINVEVNTIKGLLAEDRKRGTRHYETVEGMLAYESTLEDGYRTGTQAVCSIATALHFAALVFQASTDHVTTETLATRSSAIYTEVIAPQHNWFMNTLATVSFLSFPDRPEFFVQLGLQHDDVAVKLVSDLSEAMDAFYYELKRVIGLYPSASSCNI